MAQLVEQRIRNAQVVGSSPTSSSRRKHAQRAFFSYIRPRRVILLRSFIRDSHELYRAMPDYIGEYNITEDKVFNITFVQQK